MAARRRTVLGAVLGLLAAAALPAPSEARPYDEVMESGTVRIAVYEDFPPFSSGPADAMEGVDVALARLIAEHLGVSLQLMPVAADETLDDDLRNAIWLGPRIGKQDGTRDVADIMLHVPHDNRIKQSPSLLEGRNEMIALFAPYYREQLVIARQGATQHLDALDDERIGVELDTMADFVLTGAFGGRYRENTRRFRTTPQLRDALAAEEVDGVMGPRSEVEWMLAGQRDDLTISRPMIPRMGATEWLLGIAVREDSRDLGYEVQGLFDRMVADGSMARVFEAHGLTHTKPYAD